MPVDANTSRIFGRLFGEEGPGVRTPTSAWDGRMEPFVPRREPRRFLWATMDLAAAHCRARAPECGGCPLRAECVTGRVVVASGPA
jgi:A/G-specific adenine glycosylase